MVNCTRAAGRRVLIRPPAWRCKTSRLCRCSSESLCPVGCRGGTCGRADWGMTLDSIARSACLRFLRIKPEQYDFVVPRLRANRPAVIALKRCCSKRPHAKRMCPAWNETMTAGGIVLCWGRSHTNGIPKAISCRSDSETMLATRGASARIRCFPHHRRRGTRTAASRIAGSYRDRSR
jgi:hypothetical protein